MRARAYRPETPACLEDRSLLSAAAGLSAGPVVVLTTQWSQTINIIRVDFDGFIRDRNIPELSNQLQDAIVVIPFGRVDGLNASINGILDTMKQDIANKAPRAVHTGFRSVVAVARANLAARIQAGDVILR